MYDGGSLVAWWPDEGSKRHEALLGIHLDDQARLQQMILANHPRYFVVSEPPDRNAQLARFLTARYPIAVDAADYRIYDLTRPF